jgi:hypothetical protein
MSLYIHENYRYAHCLITTEEEPHFPLLYRNICSSIEERIRLQKWHFPMAPVLYLTDILQLCTDTYVF